MSSTLYVLLGAAFLAVSAFSVLALRPKNGEIRAVTIGTRGDYVALAITISLIVGICSLVAGLSGFIPGAEAAA